MATQRTLRLILSLEQPLEDLDEVVVIGRQGDAEITTASVAAQHGPSPHGAALAIRDRVTRGYLSGGGVASIRTGLGTATGDPAS